MFSVNNLDIGIVIILSGIVIFITVMAAVIKVVNSICKDMIRVNVKVISKRIDSYTEEDNCNEEGMRYFITFETEEKSKVEVLVGNREYMLLDFGDEVVLTYNNKCNNNLNSEIK